MSRIVQVVNFVTPTSGGLRTALQQLATGYARAGHEVVQVLPGPHDRTTGTDWGRCVALRGAEVPGAGYRLLTDVRRVTRTVATLEPDRLEVHDRTTLRGVGRWARRHGVPSLVVSHERLDRWLRQWLPARLPLDRVADYANASLAACFDSVVCTTAWAEQEFRRLQVPHLRRVPLGVDLESFTPDVTARASYAASGEVLLVMASRLSREKRPDLAIGAVAELVRRGHRVRLVVAGDGPMRASLQQRASGLPVSFVGFVDGRQAVAQLLGAADVVIAPGPVETFGLAALEALACGTPVVANVHSALPEVLGTAGRASPSTPRCMAEAVEEVLALDETARRTAARARAEQFPWTAAVEGFLRVHRLPLGSTASRSTRAAA
jgi:alpha-1,6-mannosyltransferase